MLLPEGFKKKFGILAPLEKRVHLFNTSEKKPVMVWIHGGAFVSGGANIELFDCTNLAKENPDVIFVNTQYRLGVLGYLQLSHLPDGKDYPDAQNLGLLDQMASY